MLFQNIVNRIGAHFVYLLNDCDQVTIDHVAIEQSRDGINVVSCRDVAVRNCNITGCGDDAIALKSDYALGRKIASANITVTECHLESAGNAMQIGSETVGDIRDVSFSRIGIARAGKAAIGLTSADGAIIENIHYSGITIRKAACPIFMRVTNRLRSGDATRRIGAIHQVTISDLTSTDSKPSRDVPVSPAIIVGRKNHPSTVSRCTTCQLSRLAVGPSQSNGPCSSHKAILTKLSPTRLRRRCLLVMHAACDYRMCSFHTNALMRGRRSSQSM